MVYTIPRVWRVSNPNEPVQTLREHRQKTFVTLSVFWPLKGWRGLGENGYDPEKIPLSKYYDIDDFADDTNLLCLSNSIKKLSKLVNANLKYLVSWLNANKISLSLKKKLKW